MSSRWEESLRLPGRRLTPQRRAVLQVLREADGHCTLAEIRERVRERFPEIPLPTVYRNLRYLVEAGLAAQTDLGSGSHVYEFVADKHHHHLVCLSCRQVMDLPDSFLDPLRVALKEQYGFSPRMEHFALFGICPSCAKTTAERRPDDVD
ncbi:MAG: Peroxide operon regulator [Chloroflexi bacterium ADurb.Bin180]|nr:MAG: Peroxide operon regulator [Chloroflexi bacterium ADurb.Bin180]HNT06221.1 transcriptional repressor [Anaerolineae bacterium]HQJ51661.1 transcriptional repressor [Anaerolineae bacterium]